MITPAEDAARLVKLCRETRLGVKESTYNFDNSTSLCEREVLEALLAAQEAARAEERAAAVAWHEAQAESLSLSGHTALRDLGAVHAHAATMIKSGHHLTKKEAG